MICIYMRRGRKRDTSATPEHLAHLQGQLEYMSEAMRNMASLLSVYEGGPRRQANSFDISQLTYHFAPRSVSKDETALESAKTSRKRQLPSEFEQPTSSIQRERRKPSTRVQNAANNFSTDEVNTIEGLSSTTSVSVENMPADMPQAISYTSHADSSTITADKLMRDFISQAHMTNEQMQPMISAGVPNTTHAMTGCEVSVPSGNLSKALSLDLRTNLFDLIDWDASLANLTNVPDATYDFSGQASGLQIDRASTTDESIYER